MPFGWINNVMYYTMEMPLVEFDHVTYSDGRPFRVNFASAVRVAAHDTSIKIITLDRPQVPISPIPHPKILDKVYLGFARLLVKVA